MADTLESLELEVKYKATGAAGEISAVADAVIKLRDALKGVVPKLKSLADTMAGISNPLTINDYHDNTIQQSIQKVGSTAKSAAKDVAPLSEGIRMWISDASKVDILETKFVDLSKAMNQAFEEGDAKKALHYREQIIKVTDALNRASASANGAKTVNPLPWADQKMISGLTKYGVLLEKVSAAEKKMNEAFASGDREGALRAKEQMLNAQAQAQKEYERLHPAEVAAPTPLSDADQQMISTASEIDLLKMKLESLNAAMQEAFGEGNRAKAEALRSQIINTEEALARAENAAKGASEGVKQLSKEASKSQKPLSNFISSLKRIAFYRIIRGILKSITQAFQEGLEKAYIFSSGVDGEGYRFAAAMDRIKGAGNAMKGQLGSAFISLLAAVEPVLIALINLVTKAADAVAQLFAAFTGKTYLKANVTAAKFADTMARGGAAAKEWKNQLLGFDEINRLNAPSDGGGGGGSNPLAGFDMQSADISEFWLKVAEKIKPILEDIKHAFQGLRDFVVGVFTGDWDLAFEGLAEIVESFGRIVNHVLNGLAIPLFDGFCAKVIELVDSLLQYIEEKTGLDLTKLRESVAYGLNYIRFLIEGFAIQAAWIVQDLCDAISALLRGDWDAAWEGTKKVVSDATIDVTTEADAMARTVSSAMMEGGNASADFAEAFSVNMETARGQMAATGDSSLSVNESDSGISFVARIANFVGKIFRLGARMPALFAEGGFPNEGQLFFASEQGPELVGTMGGRTAVANNQEITEGIRQAVYDAMTASNANGNNDVSVRVYLDSREIKAGQQRLNRAWGVG